MNSASTYTTTRVIGSKLNRVFASCYPFISPEKFARGNLIRDEILCRIPMWPSIQDNDREPSFSQLGSEHTAARAGADDTEISLLVRKIAHRYALTMNPRREER